MNRRERWRSTDDDSVYRAWFTADLNMGPLTPVANNMNNNVPLLLHCKSLTSIPNVHVSFDPVLIVCGRYILAWTLLSLWMEVRLSDECHACTLD